MQSNERGDFNFMLETWAARWPGAKWEPRHNAAYWMVLRLFHINDLAVALEQAASDAVKSQFTRNKIPPAETVAEFCKRLEVQRRQDEKRVELEKERRAAIANLDHVPTDPDEAAAYIAAGQDRFEQTARQWEVESKTLQLETHRPTPTELLDRRMQALRELFRETRATKEMP